MYYTYTISSDITVQALNTTRLHYEISQEGLSGFSGIVTSNGTFDVHFTSDLSAGDKTTLDGIIQNHSGEALNLPFCTHVDFIHLTPILQPDSPEEGIIYMDNATHKLRCYDGTIWNDLF